MPPTAPQRTAIAQFVNITGAPDRVAQSFLKRTAWKLDQACDAYFAQNPAPILPAATDTNLAKLFEKYRDQENDEKDTVGMAGIMEYCKAVGVDLDDASCLVALEAVQLSALGEMTKDEFVKGWKEASDNTPLDTITKQKAYIATQKSLLASDLSVFKRVYRHTFLSNKERGQRALSLDMAIASWETLFAPPGMVWISSTTNWLDLWLQFLKEKWTKSVNRDMWNETFRFFQQSMADETLSFWSEDGAWPSVIDDFVTYVKEKRAASDQMETD